MKRTLLLTATVSVFATNAYANNIVTSKTYVDNRDNLKVDIAQGVGTNNANVGKTLVVNSLGNLELGTVSADNFVEDSITDGVTNKAPSENAVHDALENKQNTIATDMVDFRDDWELPAITTYDTTGGLVANKIGILDQETILGDEGDLSAYNTNAYGAQMDNYVPTVRAVADKLTDIWDAMPYRLNWSSSLQTPINNYSTTFSSASNTWPNDTQNSVPTTETFANGLALKQNKIPARATKIESTDSTYASSVVTNGTTDGDVGQMAILTRRRVSVEDSADGGEFADYTNADNLIPTAAAVGAELSYKQNILGGTQYAGKVVTATGSSGVVTYTATYDGSTTYNASTDASKIAIVSAVQRKKTCAGWPDGVEHTDANCWLWNMPD